MTAAGVLLGTVGAGAAYAADNTGVPTYTGNEESSNYLPMAVGESSSTFAQRVRTVWAIAEFTTPWYLVRPPVPPGWQFANAEAVPCQAHHIVAQNDYRAADQRFYMALGGISVDATKNGVYLTTFYHQTLNTNAYHDYQKAVFHQFGSLPGGLTPQGAAYYTTLYLSQARDNLNSAGGCLGVFVP